jgi:hypothetical protein
VVPANRSLRVASTAAPVSAPPRPPLPIARRIVPAPSRLANRHSPSPSHHNSLIRSPRRPHKTRDLRTNPGRAPSGPSSQAVKAFAPVGGTRRQPHSGARWQAIHRNSSIICQRVSNKTSPYSQTRAPQPNSISMMPVRSTRRCLRSRSRHLDQDHPDRHHGAALDRRLRQQLPPPFE